MRRSRWERQSRVCNGSWIRVSTDIVEVVIFLYGIAQIERVILNPPQLSSAAPRASRIEKGDDVPFSSRTFKAKSKSCQRCFSTPILSTCFLGPSAHQALPPFPPAEYVAVRFFSARFLSNSRFDRSAPIRSLAELPGEEMERTIEPAAQERGRVAQRVFSGASRAGNRFDRIKFTDSLLALQSATRSLGSVRFNSKVSGPVIGIDLGTTNSCVSIMVNPVLSLSRRPALTNRHATGRKDSPCH